MIKCKKEKRKKNHKRRQSRRQQDKNSRSKRGDGWVDGFNRYSKQTESITKRNLRLGFFVSKMFTRIHAQAASTAAKTVALWTELSTVALFAKDLAFVFGNSGRLQHLLAETCNNKHKASSTPLKLHLSLNLMMSRNLPQVKHILCHFWPAPRTSSAA